MLFEFYSGPTSLEISVISTVSYFGFQGSIFTGNFGYQGPNFTGNFGSQASSSAAKFDIPDEII